jgi:hypothetical protein
VARRKTPCWCSSCWGIRRCPPARPAAHGGHAGLCGGLWVRTAKRGKPRLIPLPGRQLAAARRGQEQGPARAHVLFRQAADLAAPHLRRVWRRWSMAWGCLIDGAGVRGLSGQREGVYAGLAGAWIG